MVYSAVVSVVSGTATPCLTASTKADWITFQPGSSNAANVYVGGSNVSASGDVGFSMGAGDSFVAWPMATGAHGAYDLSKIYVDGTTTGDKVKFIYGRS